MTKWMNKLVTKGKTTDLKKFFHEIKKGIDR